MVFVCEECDSECLSPDDATEAKWLAENREAIDAYNEHVEADGVFSDGLRGF